MINDEIKEILRTIPAVLVMEDSKPLYVVSEYETWRRLAAGEQVRVSNGRPGHLSSGSFDNLLRERTIDNKRSFNDPVRQAPDPQEAQVLERLNKEILSLREQIQMQEGTVTEDV